MGGPAVLEGRVEISGVIEFLEGLIRLQRIVRKNGDGSKEEFNLGAEVFPECRGYLVASVWAVDPTVGKAFLGSICGSSMQQNHIFRYEVFERDGYVFIRGPNPNSSIPCVKGVHAMLTDMGYGMALNRFYLPGIEISNGGQTRRSA